jgi:hypothetical protein
MAETRGLSREQPRKVCARLMQAADDPRISAELRARLERPLRNLRAIQKRRDKAGPGSSPG